MESFFSNLDNLSHKSKGNLTSKRQKHISTNRDFVEAENLENVVNWKIQEI